MGGGQPNDIEANGPGKGVHPERFERSCRPRVFKTLSKLAFFPDPVPEI